MIWPAAEPGLVVRYSYLWQHEAKTAGEGDLSDRPCIVVSVIPGEGYSPEETRQGIMNMANGVDEGR